LEIWFFPVFLPLFAVAHGRAPQYRAFRGSTHDLTNPKQPERSPAALDLIARARKSSPDDPLYVVAVGAITNVSNALLLEPTIVRNIVVVWLGGNGAQWPHQHEFNFGQDLNASRTIFDSGVALVRLPCTPVVTHFTTTVPEMERYAAGRGARCNGSVPPHFGIRPIPGAGVQR